ncbi:hypothetical protein KIN20_021938 [Parelaphostrongylus tenuis]|uniref:Uncharacterized protein n=1 Tax=Parelaphostrongylus tenuis TaxID=148309 RepID=A0AAD5N8G7_PARTN|nr:hypothetical protein KIN20_021938 [Parelaphostrongylus tenuis]
MLQRNQSSHTQILKEYKLRLGQTNFAHLNDIQKEAFYTETYNKIFKLHNDWQPLLDSSSDEKGRLDLFITPHGDYRETFGTSVALLEN